MTVPIGIRFALQDGTYIDQVDLGAKTAGKIAVRIFALPVGYCVEVRNLGEPSAVGASNSALGRTARGEPVLFTDAWLGLPPSHGVKWAIQRGVRPLNVTYNGMALYSAVSMSDAKPVHHAVPESAQFHMLEGGQSVRWEILPTNVPESALPSEKARLAAIFGIVPGATSGIPRLDTLRSLWRITQESFNPTALVKDIGWWMSCINSRWPTLPNPTGWQNWGAVRWSGGLSNALHYDIVRNCLENYLRTNDSGGWEAALLLARWKVANVLIWTNAAADWVVGMNRWESTDDGKVGTAGIPAWSHSWMAGTLAVATLSGDQGLMDGCLFYGEALLRAAPNPIWWGIRMLDRPLLDLYYFWRITGDQRYRDKAIHLIDDAFATLTRLAPNAKLWPSFGNDPNGELHEPWQDASWANALGLWMDFGIGLQYANRAAAMAVECLRVGLREHPDHPGYLQGAMVWHETDQAIQSWQTPPILSFFVPVLHRAKLSDPTKYGPIMDKLKATLEATIFQDYSAIGKPLLPQEASFGSTGYGITTPKPFAETCLNVRDADLA